MNTFVDYKDYQNKRLERHYFNLAKEQEEKAGNDIGANIEVVRLSYSVLLLNKKNQDAIIMLNNACRIINDSQQVSNIKQVAELELKNCLC